MDTVRAWPGLSRHHEAALEKRIRALWIIATNPIVSCPNLGVLKQTLENAGIPVVSDGFIRRRRANSPT